MEQCIYKRYPIFQGQKQNKMYKLFNLIFDWDYIHWENTADHGIARVRRLPDGTVVYWQYRNINLLCKITNREQVTWLTCLPSKYGL